MERLDRFRGAAGLAAWIALLVAALVGANLAASVLGAPPLTAPAAWWDWAAGQAPEIVAFAIVRLFVLAMACYLLGVTVVGLVARLARAGRLVRAADLLTIPAVRRLLQGAVGVGLATAALTAPAVGDARGHPTAAVLALQADQIASGAGTPGAHAPGAGGAGAATETLRLLPAQDADDAVLRLEAAVGTGQESLAVEAEATWQVEPGQHFWAKAETVLRAAWGRPVTDAEVVGYWWELVDANRAALADPGNPDLIYPGQVFRVPDPPAPPVGS